MKLFWKTKTIWTPKKYEYEVSIWETSKGWRYSVSRYNGKKWEIASHSITNFKTKTAALLAGTELSKVDREYEQDLWNKKHAIQTFKIIHK